MDADGVNGNEVRFFVSCFDSLDNFSAHSIEMWGKQFPTAEHAFQWRKFSDSNPGIAAKVLEARSPEIAKEIAKDNKQSRSPNWQQEKVSIMEEILRNKLAQHENISMLLLDTDDKIIVEGTPTDAFWGAGPDNRGENMIGKIWMRLRDELRKGTKSP